MTDDIALPCVVAFAPRERTRAMLRAAFPRRRSRLLLARTSGDFASAFHAELVDAAVVDVGGGIGHEDTWVAAAQSREFPSAPFFAFTPMRAADGPVLAQCVALEFAGVLVEGVDDACARDVVCRRGFTARFTDALRVPPPALALTSRVQERAWEYIVSRAGRRVRTVSLARHLGVTREHLSRTFAAEGAPNLKRVIDLVRLLAAAELAKNPGYDVRDIASVLDFASSSHLSSTAQRIAGGCPVDFVQAR